MTPDPMTAHLAADLVARVLALMFLVGVAALGLAWWGSRRAARDIDHFGRGPR